MSTEENKALVRRYFEEVWNKGNLAILEELQEAEYVEHSRKFVPMWRSAFPDSQITINTLVAEGGTVVIGFTTQGTHLGMLEGSLLPTWFPQPLPPTGKRVEYRGLFVYSIGAGKIQRQGHWGLLDWITLLRQLGFTVAPDDAAK